MASAVVLPLLLLFVVLSGSTASVVDQHAAGVDEINYIVLETSSWLKPETVCSGLMSSPHPNITNWLPLTRPYGPCSSGSSAAPPAADLLWSDQHRADYIQWKLSAAAVGVSLATIPDEPSKSDVQMSNMLKVNTGDNDSPPQSKATALAATGGREQLPGVVQTVVLDTASDVAWLQCSPCPAPACYPQTDVLYDPSKSSASGIFSCNSATCRQLGPYANGCLNNQCQYRVQYPDGRSSSGTYIYDLLTLTPTASVPKFLFGCSHAVQGQFSGSAAGIMALGGGPESLVSQTASMYGRVFSHCFAATASRTGFFILGVPRVASWRYVLTPLLKIPALPPTYYMVRLQAITVAGQHIAVPPTVFAPGAALDSRTAITRLPPTAYQALRQAFRDRMTMYRPAPPKGPLDTCYDMTGVRTFALPRITLVFDRNAAVELDPSAVLYEGSGCLAFAAGPNDLVPGIIGYVQLQTLEVLYNIPAGLVGFRHAAC